MPEGRLSFAAEKWDIYFSRIFQGQLVPATLEVPGGLIDRLGEHVPK